MRIVQFTVVPSWNEPASVLYQSIGAASVAGGYATPYQTPAVLVVYKLLFTSRTRAGL